MDEAGRVLARLTKIDELREELRAEVRAPRDCNGGAAPELLAELRALVPEAEAWARAEGDTRARTAAAKLRAEAEGMD
jgi:hypothetical protein